MADARSKPVHDLTVDILTHDRYLNLSGREAAIR